MIIPFPATNFFKSLFLIESPSLTDFTALGDFQAQISDLQQQIDALEEEWMEAAEKLGE